MLLPLLSALGGLPVLAQATDQPAPAPAPAPAPPPEAPPPPPPTEPDLSDLEDFLAASAAPPPPAPPAAANALNPRLTAFGDAFWSGGFGDFGLLPGSTFWLRSLELDIRADVDPFAKAVAVIAMHQEPPALEGHAHEEGHEEEGAEAEEAHDHASFAVSPEEVYIDLVALPAGLTARIGQQRLPFGVTNRAHPHDWPWPAAPLPLAATLGEEGLADVGGVVEWRVPNPWRKGISLTAGAVSGASFDPEGETAIPGWIGRAELFDHLGRLEIGLGAGAVGLQDDRVQGADLMLRWRPNGWRSVVLLGEAFQPVSDGQAGELGWTGSLQVQPARSLYWGLRVDHLGEEWRYGSWLSAYTSEFLRVRAGALTDEALENTQVDVQLTFVWGSHPVEPYWVNR